MKQYVVGFLFTPDNQRVVLIEKHNPAWQRGLYNGVGGKIEAGETPLEAMIREFEEEAGVKTQANDWRHIARILRPGDYDLSVFAGHSALALEAKTVERELIALLPVDALPAKLMPNLKWLIPMALDEQLDISAPIQFQEVAGERTVA